MKVIGNMVGGNAPLKTVVIVDDNGNECVGVVVDNFTLFTATDEDVVAGKVYAGDNGVSTGTHECK